ncbi:MAG: hypothetical protein CME36_03800 [unclassified Hahellaceae]|nr:hypothetical protein [Hahellaceae bacterium]|tara:strand:+ start:8181 stop:8531 length:351 start_codon:yes stop_codon:yes gene_type:complete
MSFDILVIERSKVDLEQPRATYKQIVEGTFADIETRSAAVEKTYNGVNILYRDMHGFDNEAGAKLPWVGGVVQGNCYLLFCISAGIDKVGFIVQDQADTNGLVVYDPQADMIVGPF